MDAPPSLPENPTSTVEFLNRRSKGASRYRFRVAGTELRVVRQGNYDIAAGPPSVAAPAIVFPLRDVTEMWLTPHPLRELNNRCLCRLKFRDGHVLRVTNKQYVDQFTSDDQSTEFGKFVRALSAAIVAQNPATQFACGQPTLPLLLGGGAFILGLMGLFYLLFLTDSIDPVWLVPAALVGKGLGWGLFIYARRARPRRFDPHAVPDQVLPLPKLKLPRTRP